MMENLRQLFRGKESKKEEANLLILNFKSQKKQLPQTQK